MAIYRLPHETIIPALRRLTGLVLAEAEQAELKLKTAYEAWQKSNSKNPAYLLQGKELHQVLKYLPQISWQADEKATFIKHSKQKRNRIRCFAYSFILLLGLSGFYGWQAYLVHTYRQDLLNWGLPADLYDYQTQLEILEINDEDVRHLHWLKQLPNLKELTLIAVQLNDLNELVEKLPALTTLDLSNTSLTSLEGLENLPALISLDLRDTSVNNLQSLPATVTTLKLGIK